MEDRELFELCKEVYERTEWDGTEKCYAYLENPYIKGIWDWEISPCHEDNVDGVNEWHPLYTSDYLLEKLPKKVKHPATGGEHTIGVSWHIDKRQWVADYERSMISHAYSDTPLKALLKLTIALHDAKELL